MKKYRGLVVREPMLLLSAVVGLIDHPKLSFEGYNLKDLNFERFGTTVYDSPTEALEKNIISPPSDFVILEPTGDGKLLLMEMLASLEPDFKNVVHVQINEGDTRVFQAHDNFEEFGVYLLEEIAKEAVQSFLDTNLITETFMPSHS